MEHDFPNGMNSLYEADRQRRSWAGLPHFQSNFPENSAQPGAHTLPPIQSQRPSYDHGVSSFEQQSRQQPPLYSTQGTPYPNYVSHASHPPYGHALPHFSTSSSLISSPAPAFPVSQAYGTPTSAAFPHIRPMPAPTSQAHSISPTYVPNPSFGFANSNDDNEMQPRTHVVGSQGRRGILPSAEGKPAAVTSNGNTGTKNTVIPQKDADGKFPCPHCQKSYLHGKHLKRHMLRHTGDRPYTCILCNDTFSRSDILKRHFQKCSIRRGNPTGATHLSHSQSHLKKQGAKKPQTPSDINTTFPGTAPAGPHSASPIYNDSGIGMNIGVSGPQPQPDASKAFQEGAAKRDQRSYTNPSPSFTRPNFNYVAGQNGPASLPSSGSSTPLTAKGTGHFHQSFPTEASQQRISSYNEVNHRPGQPQIPSTQFDGNQFDWPNYPHVKEEPENHVGQPEHDGVQVKSEGLESKPVPGTIPSDHHDDFMV